MDNTPFEQRDPGSNKSRRRDSAPDTTMRIYGIPLEAVHRTELGPILEGREDYPFIGFLYCGYKAGPMELRSPSQRLFYIRKADVHATGAVADFVVDGIPVLYYEIDIVTSVKEKTFSEVRIADEVQKQQNVFAARLAVPPSQASLPLDVLRQLGEAFAMRGGLGGLGPGAGGLNFAWGGTTGTGSSCGTWYQTYLPTYYDPFEMSDASGADCDYED